MGANYCRRSGVRVLHVVKAVGHKTPVRISRVVHAMSLRDDVSELIFRLKPFLNGYNAQLFHTHSPMSGAIGRVCALPYKSTLFHTNLVCAVVDTTNMLTSWLLEPAMEIEVSLVQPRSAALPCSAVP
jgi:hypothetical protein